MHAHQIEEQAHETLPPDIADRLLELLSTSDVFRAKFQRDPAGALHDIGHEPAAAMRGKRPFKGQPYYCLTGELASKEEIRRSREALKQYLTRRINHQVIYFFGSGEMGAALRQT